MRKKVKKRTMPTTPPTKTRGIRKSSTRLNIKERELADTAEKYKTLVENVNIGVYRNTGGPKGRFIHANPAIARMFGYRSVQEFMSQCFF